VRPRSVSVSTRFFIALFVLLGALAAVVVFGLRGIGDVQHANDQLYADNLISEQATSQLGFDLNEAKSLSLSIASASNVAESDRLRAELEQVAIPKVETDIAEVLRLHSGDSASEHATVARIPEAWQRALAADRQSASAEGSGSQAARRETDARTLAAAIDRLIDYVGSLRPVEVRSAAGAHAGAQHTFVLSRVWLLLSAAVALVAAAAMVRVGFTLKRLLDRQRAEERYSASEDEYIDTLQVTGSEDEAQELLRRQLERTLDDARALVLARNNSADRLEPKTSIAAFDGLQEQMIGATPRSCLAVRLGRTHAEGDDASALIGCEVCGGLPGASTCEPLLVGGEVIGSVLINQPTRGTDRDRQRIRDTVAQAAPVLANLRNLELAQLRAATDALTGLPNHRAAQDTLKRMVAQAARTVSPLAALLVDLDHFKKINDVHGHERGDDVLAAAGAAFRGVLRESDFVARYGGEEFLLLLPGTDEDGALHVGEALRNAIATMTVAELDQPVTASVGVAVLPEDAADAVTLFRAADRALYAAKKHGRNRVEAASASAEGNSPSADQVETAARG
jgi:diguanylate cyclase (GGDEF)-like protein